MLQDPPLLTIRRALQRPSPELIGKLRGAQTGHLVDAMLGRGALDPAVKPVDPERAQFVGSALTCETGPSDNLAILAAIAIAVPGDVIVAASDAFSATAVVGDNMAAMAKNKGIAAIVVDGMARDSEGIVGVGLPVFARGITPNSCVRSGPGKVGLPIVCAGVAVQSGDLVLGDRDGVVIVPGVNLAHIVAKLGDIRRAEQETQEKIRSGITQMDSISRLLESDQVVYLD